MKETLRDAAALQPQRVAILGLGLIGGSLGLALRAGGGGNVRVTGYARQPQTRDLALRLGAVDAVAATPGQAVADADVVFLCTPVLQMLPLAAAVLPRMKRGAVLTDVGSTKRWFAREVRPLLPAGVHFVGGHPMAGREKSGLEAAQADLFRDRWYLFTPLPKTPPDVVEGLRSLVGLTGAVTAVMEDARHDQVTAVISHVPHITAAALVHLLEKEKNPAETARFIGGGFRDTTRIASSDADMWADICMTNPEYIAANLDELAEVLAGVAMLVRSGDRAAIHRYFAGAKQLRDSLLAQGTGNG